MIRAFVAILLPEDLRAVLIRLQAQFPVGRLLPPENLHLTLVFPGAVSEPVLDEVHLALSHLRADPVTPTFAGIGMFGGTRPRTIHAMVQREPALDQAVLAGAGFRAGPVPVTQVALFRSDPGRGPARHTALARYPLCALPNP